jgi:PleD family two-component response regulator
MIHHVVLLIARPPTGLTRCNFEMPKDTLISIVDDDRLARDGIRELVESLGYKAVTFGSAEDFLESDVITETACLITDLQMPGLNGLELPLGQKRDIADLLLLQRKSKGCNLEIRLCCQLAVLKLVFRINRGN